MVYILYPLNLFLESFLFLILFYTLSFFNTFLYPIFLFYFISSHSIFLNFLVSFIFISRVLFFFTTFLYHFYFWSPFLFFNTFLLTLYFCFYRMFFFLHVLSFFVNQFPFSIAIDEWIHGSSSVSSGDISYNLCSIYAQFMCQFHCLPISKQIDNVYADISHRYIDYIYI